MRTQCHAIDPPNHSRRRVAAAFDDGRMSSDGGALLLRVADSVIHLTKRVAVCFTDYRDPSRCEHSVRYLVAQRVFALILGYENVNEHDILRADSLMDLALGRADITGQRRARERDRGCPVAGSSTLNRLKLGPPELAGKDRCERIVADADQLDALLVDVIVERQEEAPAEIVLDVEATNDRLHGGTTNQSGMPPLA